MGTDNVFSKLFLNGLELLPMGVNIELNEVRREYMPEIKDVIFNDPATIVFWSDGSKTIVKCQKQNGDVFSKETGLAMAIAKKAYGNKGNFNDVFAKWLVEKK